MVGQRLKPFLFMVNQRLETEDEAQQVLSEYLAAYGQDYAIDYSTDEG